MCSKEIRGAWLKNMENKQNKTTINKSKSIQKKEQRIQKFEHCGPGSILPCDAI